MCGWSSKVGLKCPFRFSEAFHIDRWVLLPTPLHYSRQELFFKVLYVGNGQGSVSEHPLSVKFRTQKYVVAGAPTRKAVPNASYMPETIYSGLRMPVASAGALLGPAAGQWCATEFRAANVSVKFRFTLVHVHAYSS